MVPTFAIAKNHSRVAPRKTAGAPGHAAKSYKLDGELTRRSKDRNGSNTTRVIVTLVPGAQLPPGFVNPLKVCPVDPPRAFGDGFGAPRYTGTFHLHAGDDILADSPHGHAAFYLDVP